MSLFKRSILIIDETKICASCLLLHTFMTSICVLEKRLPRKSLVSFTPRNSSSSINSSFYLWFRILQSKINLHTVSLQLDIKHLSLLMYKIFSEEIKYPASSCTVCCAIVKINRSRQLAAQFNSPSPYHQKWSRYDIQPQREMIHKCKLDLSSLIHSYV